jgi:hypothetical protein
MAAHPPGASAWGRHRSTGRIRGGASGASPAENPAMRRQVSWMDVKALSYSQRQVV